MFDIALMPVTREWLRVDLEPDRTIASITLTDTPNAVAVHLGNDGDAGSTDGPPAPFATPLPCSAENPIMRLPPLFGDRPLAILTDHGSTRTQSSAGRYG